MTEAEKWLEAQAINGYPALVRGDAFLSKYHGNLISTAIAYFQKKGCDWSHTGIYVGMGQIAESTTPHGGVNWLKKYFGKRYTVAIYRIRNITIEQRAMFCSEAVRLAPRPYDKLSIARHLIDNFFERLTWNGSSGWRPLAKLVGDRDKDLKNNCSEMFERSLYYAIHAVCQSGKLGQARPADVGAWLTTNAALVMEHQKGKLT